MDFSVERYHDISCGHRVYGHEGACSRLHGHNYRIHFVCVPVIYPGEINRSSNLDSVGRVIDFGVIKEKLGMWVEAHWDHKFLIYSLDPVAASLKLIDPNGVVCVDFNPTAENMAEYLVTVVGHQQLACTGVTLKSVTIEETAKCWATYTLEQ